MTTTALPSRRWYRLYASTWVAIALTLTPLILIVVPACPTQITVSFEPFHYEHGWPFVWMDRFVWPGGGPAVDPDQCWDILKSKGWPRWAREGDAFWIERSGWQFSGQCFLQWKGLVLDLAFAIILSAAFAFLWEWWRRRRCQYRLRSLFVLAFLLSVLLAWWRIAAVQWERERQMIDAIEQCDFNLETSSAAPGWLARLVGVKHLPSFVIGIEGPTDPSKGLDHVPDAFAIAKGFRNLDLVDLDDVDDRTLALLATLDADLQHLRAGGGLRKVDITGAVTAAGLENLKGMTRLRELWLNEADVTYEDVKKLQQELPNCKISWEQNSP